MHINGHVKFPSGAIARVNVDDVGKKNKYLGTCCHDELIVVNIRGLSYNWCF